MDRMIWVSLAREGIHCYPDAPVEVAFLRNPHRHIFKIKVAIEVWHDDREIEFIMFKRRLEGYYDGRTLDLNTKSCEMIADDLHAQIKLDYPGRAMVIDVAEDGENGAVIHYSRH